MVVREGRLKTRQEQYQEQVDLAAMLFKEGGFYAFAYKFYGDDFKPETPQEHEERAIEITEKLDILDRIKKEHANMEENHGLLRKSKNHFSKVFEYLIYNSWSYFCNESRRIAVSSYSPGSHTITEEFTHGKSFFDTLDSVIEREREYLDVIKQKKKTEGKEKEALEEKLEELKFKKNIHNIFIEGHKNKKAVHVPKTASPKFKNFLKQFPSFMGFMYLSPVGYFANRTSWCHATADTFFKSALKETNPELADVFMKNLPTKEEWKDLGLYFDKLKEKLNPNDYKNLKAHARKIKKKMVYYQLGMDALMVYSGLVLYIPMIYSITELIKRLLR